MKINFTKNYLLCNEMGKFFVIGNILNSHQKQNASRSTKLLSFKA